MRTIFALLLTASFVLAGATDVMQERLLVTLPRGLEVKVSQLPYALLFASDGRQVTYFARYRDGDLMNEAVVHRGVRGPATTFIVDAALSPDGSRVAYLASFRDNVRAAYLIVGNHRDQVQIKEGKSNAQWVPVFSPDGRKLAYKAETANGRHVMRVADVSDIPPESHSENTYTPLTSAAGPEFDDVDQARFSADGMHVAYAARNGGRWTVVVDGTPGPFFSDASDPVFRPDGRAVAYRATRDQKKYFVVVGDETGPGFDMVSQVAFSPDGRTVAYGALEGRTSWIVVGADKRPAAHFAAQVAFSSDGKRVSYWTIEEKGRGKEHVIVNDKAGPAFDQVGWPVFDHTATLAAYWARDKDKYLMVTGERRSDRFDGVGRTRVFSADGSALAFGVLQGNELRWTVMKTR